MLAEMRKRGHAYLDPVFERCDVVVALADSPLCRYSSAVGKRVSLPCHPSLVQNVRLGRMLWMHRLRGWRGSVGGLSLILQQVRMTLLMYARLPDWLRASEHSQVQRGERAAVRTLHDSSKRRRGVVAALHGRLRSCISAAATATTAARAVLRQQAISGDTPAVLTGVMCKCTFEGQHRNRQLYVVAMEQVPLPSIECSMHTCVRKCGVHIAPVVPSGLRVQEI